MCRELAVEIAAELERLNARPKAWRRTGMQSLTQSQLRVARLAADGLSNQAIARELWLTVKTVESHLSATYRKLGISSRTQLPAMLEPVALTQAA